MRYHTLLHILTVLTTIGFLVSTTISCTFPLALPSPEAPSSPSTPSLSPTPNTTPSSSAEFSTPPMLVIPDTSQSAEQIVRSYTWEYSGREWNIEIEIPLMLYDYYRELPRPPTHNYSVYVTHPSDDAYISDLVNELRRSAQKEGYKDLETVGFTAAFVQNLPYTADSASTEYDEYPRYPIETLVDNGGDCEDTSILTASLLHGLGYKVSLIEFPDKHCAVGVSFVNGVQGTYFEDSEDRYFYLETTNTGWGVGEMPEELKAIEAYVYNMAPTPIITHNWKGTIGGDIAELEITVKNLGSQSAEVVYIVAGFDAGEDILWNVEESETFDLPTNHILQVTINLQVPLERHTRIVIQIIYGGYKVDDSYSEWFET